MTETAAAAPVPRWDIARLAALPRPLLIATIPALCLLVLFAELPTRPLYLHVIEKLGHPGVFAVIALCALALQWPGAPGRAPWRDYLVAFGLCVLLGGATEAGQMFTNRHTSLADVGLDARGALCALSLAAAFDWRVWSRSRHPMAAYLLGIVAFLGLAALILLPLGHAAAAYARRAHNFPVLLSPATPLDVFFLDPGEQTLETAAGDLGGASHPVLRVPLPARPYAGVTLSEPSPDWRGYRELVVDIENPGGATLDLTVRVEDRGHGERYEDRYNGVFQVAPHARRTIVVPLALIAAAPKGRTLDLGRISGLALFRAGDDGPDAFLLAGVSLR